MQPMKSCSRKCPVMNTKKFTGNFHRNDFIILLNGFLIIRASKNGLSKRKPQVCGALGKVRTLSMLFVCNANVCLRNSSWIWQNDDSVGPDSHFSSYNSLTMNRTAVIDAAKSRVSELKSPVVFFYCDYEYNGELDASFIISSFIKQICEFQNQIFGYFPKDVAPALRRFFGPERIRPDFDDLEHVFSQLYRVVPDTVYIIDGIDALQEKHAIRLLKFVQQLFGSPHVSQRSRILLLSRDQVPGYINVGTFIHGICQIPISTNATQDIESYIETSITEKMMYRKLTDDVLLIKKIKETLHTESSNMYDAKIATIED